MIATRTPPLLCDAALFLDADGTLSDLAPSPSEAKVLPSTLKVLKDTYSVLDGAVALISGRSIAQLDLMFAPLHLPAAGMHGLERRDFSGRLRTPSADSSRLDAARSQLRSLVHRVPGLLLEDKGLAIAVHYRRVPAAESTVVKAVLDIAASLGDGVHPQFGNMVAELKAGHRTKASAVADFMEEPPFAGRRPVFLGDDLTDLDAFEWVERNGGIAVAVGDRVHASYALRDSAGVRSWLRALSSASRKATG